MQVGSIVECIKICEHTKLVARYCPIEIPEVGSLYVVREVQEYMGQIGLILEEIINPKFNFINGYLEPAFCQEQFREVQQPQSLEFILDLQNAIQA